MGETIGGMGVKGLATGRLQAVKTIELMPISSAEYFT